MRKNKRVMIRITETQFEMLGKHVIKEEKTKSEYIRKLILTNLEECWIPSK